MFPWLFVASDSKSGRGHKLLNRSQGTLPGLVCQKSSQVNQKILYRIGQNGAKQNKSKPSIMPYKNVQAYRLLEELRSVWLFFFFKPELGYCNANNYSFIDEKTKQENASKSEISLFTEVQYVLQSCWLDILRMRPPRGKHSFHLNRI